MASRDPVQVNVNAIAASDIPVSMVKNKRSIATFQINSQDPLFRNTAESLLLRRGQPERGVHYIGLVDGWRRSLRPDRYR